MSRKTRNNVWYAVAVILISIALIGVLAWLYPTEGLTFRGTTYRFASLDKYEEFLSGISGNENDSSDICDLNDLSDSVSALADSAETSVLEDEAEYINYFMSAAGRIYFPLRTVDNVQSEKADSLLLSADSISKDTLLIWKDSVLYSYFDDFYAALDSASEHSVRIVHFGDSQIEEDRISLNLRRNLQERFGGGGVGLLPYRHTYYNLTVSEQLSGQVTHYSLISYYADANRKGNNFGPLLQAAEVGGQSQMSVFPRKNVKRTSAHYFNQLMVLSDGKVKVHVESPKIANDSSYSSGVLTFDLVNLPDSTTNVQFVVKGKGDVYGLSLQDNTGVNVDNIPLRGCSGTIFKQVNSKQLAEYFAATNTRLIILEFGGNSIGGLSSQRSINNYLDRLIANAKHLQELAPNASILFIGPSDMVKSVNGVRTTNPVIPRYDTIAKQKVTQAGFAYWSMFDAMGGNGSMCNWVKSSPQLAASDHVHFTRTGANTIGEALSEAIMKGYEYYKSQKE